MGCCGDEPKEPADKPRRRAPFTRKNVCCTDILALILFVAFVGLMVYIAVLSIWKGDARRLVFGYDSFGNTCNEDNTNNVIVNVTDSGRDLSGMDNVLFMSVFDPFDAMQICVSKCPKEDLLTPEAVKKFAEETGSRLCHYDIPVSEYGDSKHYDSSGNGPCPKLPIFRSVSILQRCAPDPSALIRGASSKLDDPMNANRKNATDSFFQVFELDDLFRKVLSDLYMAYREIIILCVVALVVSFLVVLMIRFLAPFIVWLIVVLAALGSLLGTAFLWWTFVRINRNLTEQMTWKVPLLGIEISNERAFLIFSIVATVLTVILLLVLLILRKRIALAVALFKEAGKCVIDVPLILIQPIWTFIILAAFFIYWLVILAFIGTAGHPVANYDRGFQSVEFVLDGFASHFWWIHLIGLIWISEMILACQQFVLGGTVAKWYFAGKEKQKSMGCVCCSVISSLILHHLGSVAAGSLIITLVKIPRYILMYINSKLEGKENGCAKCCAKCCICCLWCLEKILKFLNQNAYTFIAMKGISFCPAAKKAFGVITSNILRVAAINSVGTFVLFLGKIGVTAATCAISVVWLRENELLHFYAIPVFLVTVFAFLSAHCALTVYEMVVDALLLCFAEDCDINEGSGEYYMSSSLMEYVKLTSSKLEKRPKANKAVTTAADPVEGREMTPLANEI